MHIYYELKKQRRGDHQRSISLKNQNSSKQQQQQKKNIKNYKIVDWRNEKKWIFAQKKFTLQIADTEVVNHKKFKQ